MIRQFTVFTIACASLLATAQSFAGTTQCASADANVAYSFKQPDGGAHVESSTQLRVDGKTLVDIGGFGGHALKMADYSFGEKQKTLGQKKHGDYVTKVYATLLKVTSKADGTELFNDFVICAQETYHGAPRP